MISRNIDKVILQAAGLCGIDRLFRRVNKDRLLVVMYHGVTINSYDPPVWTQLPEQTFRKQLEFLSREYVFVTLTEVVTAIRTETMLPERAALITFDDGLRNNYSIVTPILLEMGVPAAIFLTVDLVGTDTILWVDELYFLLQEAIAHGIPVDLKNAAAERFLRTGRLWEAYEIVVEDLKRAGVEKRTFEMNRLRKKLPVNVENHLADFGMLTWDNVRAMQQSGLVEFGVHTATHRILTELDRSDWDKEIAAPKQTLEKELGCKISAFCFPNGRPNMDFRHEHLSYLRRVGYSCAFSTECSIFDMSRGNCMAIGRIPAGNSSLSEQTFFQLNTSGAIPFIRNGLTRMSCGT